MGAEASEKALRFHLLNLRSAIKESLLCMRRIYSRLLWARRLSLFRETSSARADPDPLRIDSFERRSL